MLGCTGSSSAGRAWTKIQWRVSHVAGGPATAAIQLPRSSYHYYGMHANVSCRAAWRLAIRQEAYSVFPASTKFLLQHSADLQRTCEHGSLVRGQISDSGNMIRAHRKWSHGAIGVRVLRFVGWEGAACRGHAPRKHTYTQET